MDYVTNLENGLCWLIFSLVECKQHMAITIDSEAADGSNSHEVGQNPTLFIDMRKSQSSHAARFPFFLRDFSRVLKERS
jgi:hypothetical protein